MGICSMYYDLAEENNFSDLRSLFAETEDAVDDIDLYCELMKQRYLMQSNLN